MCRRSSKSEGASGWRAACLPAVASSRRRGLPRTRRDIPRRRLRKKKRRRPTRSHSRQRLTGGAPLAGARPARRRNRAAHRSPERVARLLTPNSRADPNASTKTPQNHQPKLAEPLDPGNSTLRCLAMFTARCAFRYCTAGNMAQLLTTCKVYCEGLTPMPPGRKSGPETNPDGQWRRTRTRPLRRLWPKMENLTTGMGTNYDHTPEIRGPLHRTLWERRTVIMWSVTIHGCTIGLSISVPDRASTSHWSLPM